VSTYRDALFRLTRMATEQRITKQEVEAILQKVYSVPEAIGAQIIHRELDAILQAHGPALPL